MWPNYVKEHGFLFEGEDVRAAVRADVARREGIEVVPGMGQGTLVEILSWVVGVLKEGLER